MAVFICQGCGVELDVWDGKCPTCGATETIRLAPNTDRMIDKIVRGKFKVMRKLGQGGMGAVYLAEQLGIGHRVALKFLKSEFSSDPEIARRFLNEARSYARVAHPNAVGLHDCGQDEDGNLFIAMEYCEGVDLTKAIAEKGRLPLGEAIDVVMQVADVLANAHDKGVIHRDLKPENIMIRRGIRGVHAKVLDFGIARLIDGGTRLTVAGAIAGTPRYMSPEQVEGREVDPRSDVYSLGIVLFETLTGSQPFDGSTIAEIMRKQVLEPMPHLQERVPELDYPELDAVIQRACAKSRDFRWPDMISFAHALSRATPTQANLSAMSVQRTEVSGVAAPLPLEVEVPTEVARAPAAAARGQPAAPRRGAGRTPSGQGTEPDIGAIQLERTVAADADVTPAVSRSKGPLIAAAIAVALLVAGGVLLTRSPEPAAPPAPAVAPLPPARAEPAQAPPETPRPTAADDTAAAVARALREQTARENLGRGKTELSLANLDEAQTRLEAVGEDTPAFLEARPLLEQIATIRQKLSQARALRSQGQCAAALGPYEQALKLNPKLAEAIEGVRFCKASSISTTIE